MDPGAPPEREFILPCGFVVGYDHPFVLPFVSECVTPGEGTATGSGPAYHLEECQSLLICMDSSQSDKSSKLIAQVYSSLA